MKLVDHKEFLRISTDTQFEAPGATTIMQEIDVGITGATSARAADRQNGVSTQFPAWFLPVMGVCMGLCLFAVGYPLSKLLATWLS